MGELAISDGMTSLNIIADRITDTEILSNNKNMELFLISSMFLQTKPWHPRPKIVPIFFLS